MYHQMSLCYQMPLIRTNQSKKNPSEMEAALPGVGHAFNTFLTSQSIEIKNAFKGAFDMHLYNVSQYGLFRNTRPH